MLGLIIEQVSHQSYESYIRQNILMPLHMKQTYFKT
ncbi:serine hydrolase [Staphylococcus aureus]